jgi:hypothetical protein
VDGDLNDLNSPPTIDQVKKRSKQINVGLHRPLVGEGFCEEETK